LSYLHHTPVVLPGVCYVKGVKGRQTVPHNLHSKASMQHIIPDRLIGGVTTPNVYAVTVAIVVAAIPKGQQPSPVPLTCT